MYRKAYFGVFFLAALLVTANFVIAQTAPVSGNVQLKKADGTSVPAEGVLVEVFRTDIKGALPSAKTNKRGEFAFAGVPLAATFMLAFSGTGMAPTYLLNIKAGNDKISITMSEGDGRRLTQDEVRQAAAGGVSTAGGGGTRELTAEQKKQRAEYDKQVAEATAKNKDIENKNAVIKRTLEEGNAAFEAKNYDVAIVKYTEGVDADPTFAGSAPVLLNNKAIALRTRGVMLYNQSVKAEPAARVEAFKKVKKDLADSLAAFNQTVTIAKGAGASDPDAKSISLQKASALNGAVETMRIMGKTKQVDDSVPDIAAGIVPEYLAVETDAAKKAAAQLILADVYRVANKPDNAIAE
ncbi:MAG: carboxypeptidase-like regulatory domain-containing protein, partial [Acidobacteria bacterium]|nr:carboxypeptidase-like regulatory domain-containing protein [Acidobacteriota bacterium]